MPHVTTREQVGEALPTGIVVLTDFFGQGAGDALGVDPV